jgi:hypothetical protein
MGHGNLATRVASWAVGKMRQLDRNLFDSYRPELHYMRGPGPKWREKHGQLPAGTDFNEIGMNGLRNAGA